MTMTKQTQDFEKTTQALCADAGDEESEIIRLHDRSLIEISEVPARLKALLVRLEFLFVEKEATSLGYTAYMLHYLQRQRLVRLPDGSHRKLGGIDAGFE